MRILAVTYSRAMFGANRSLLAMMKDLRDRYGVEVEVLMPSVVDGDFAEVLDAEGFTHYEMSMKMWVYPSDISHKKLRSLSAQVKTYFLSKSIDKLLRHNTYDLIYSNNSTVQYGAILAQKWKVPHIWHVREMGTLHYNIEFSYPIKERISYFKKASAVIAISDAVADYAKTELCPGANIKRIYNGIHLDKKPRIPGQNECVNIVCVGALQPGKGQKELLGAVKMIQLQYAGSTDNIRINLVGSGPTEESLREYVKDNGLDGVVEFCGYRSDVRSMLDSMDIGVICSKAEGFGRVTCEYMEASLPVVGTDSGATPELVEDGVNGYLYPPGKTDILAERLWALIQDRKRLQSMGQRAYEKVYSDFSVTRNTDEMYKVFLSAVK